MLDPIIEEGLARTNKALAAKYGAAAALTLEAPAYMRRWIVLIGDIGAFLGSEYADQADQLGWDALDLFGCDRERPYARIDRAGLLLLLAGDRIVELSEDRATIMRSTTKTLQNFQRRYRGAGRVPVWALPAR